MAKTARGKSTSNAATDNNDAESPRDLPTQEEIAARAYHIYLQRDEGESDPVEDWLQAERELTEGQ
jgi:hypothetical protein